MPSELVPLVRMGIHSCVPVVTKNPLNSNIKYTGLGVHVVSKLCSIAHVFFSYILFTNILLMHIKGGQILFGNEVYTGSMQTIHKIEPFCVESLGYQKEDTFPENFVVYQVRETLLYFYIFFY